MLEEFPFFENLAAGETDTVSIAFNALWRINTKHTKSDVSIS